jgi:hypothetical protein
MIRTCFGMSRIYKIGEMCVKKKGYSEVMRQSRAQLDRGGLPSENLELRITF